MRKIDVGNYSFANHIEDNSFYIDKSLFIKDYIENASMVTLITRPRRFGKTMNLDMLQLFFDVTNNQEQTQKLFKNMKISMHQNIIEKNMNKYPVIRVDLKDVDGNTYEEFQEYFYVKIQKLYDNYVSLIDKNKISKFQLKTMNDILNGKITITIAKMSLGLLTELLYKTYEKKPIVLIDEYDMPLEKAYAKGYYESAQNLHGAFLSSALKGNEYLHKALLVGCSKVAQSGIFSGLNNLSVHSINSDSIFSAYFGFTEEEVKEALKEYALTETFEDVKFWYDGYVFNGKTIYNPWSVTNYLREKKLGHYWINTGSLRHIRKSLLKVKDYDKLFMSLIQEEKVTGTYSDFISYSKSSLSKNDILSLLYQAGYLKMTDNKFKPVNYETKVSLKEEFVELIDEKTAIPTSYNDFFINLTDLDISAAISDYEEMLNDTLFSDPETSHHILLMVASHFIKNNYTATRESANAAGRSDFILKSLDRKSGFIIEVKRAGERDRETLDDLVSEALMQINSRKYASVLQREGYEKIHHVALAIKGANVSIKLENKDYPEYKDIKEYLISR